MRLVPVKYLKLNSVIALDIIGNSGSVVIRANQTVNQGILNMLNKLHVESVYIQDEYCSHNDSCENTISNIKPFYTTIRKLKRISGDVIYGNAGESEFAEMTEIADEIVALVLKLPKDFTLTYEPVKLVVNTVLEQSLYVSIMSVALGLKLDLAKEDLKNLCLVGLMHNFALLSSKINPDIQSSFELHPTVGYYFLKNMYDFEESILQGILQHHEKYDGSGYPSGLSGEAINLYARIVSVIDFFYEIKSKDIQIAIKQDIMEMLFQDAMKEFDPHIASVFLRSFELFSPDTLVELTNRDIGVIVKNNAKAPFKPCIKIIKSQIFDYNEPYKLVS